jgi:hypothetical protein
MLQGIITFATLVFAAADIGCVKQTDAMFESIHPEKLHWVSLLRVSSLLKAIS